MFGSKKTPGMAVAAPDTGTSNSSIYDSGLWTGGGGGSESALERYQHQKYLNEMYHHMIDGNYPHIAVDHYGHINQILGGAGSAQSTVPRPPQYTHIQKLLMRLNMHQSETAPFENMHVVHIPGAQSVAVFFVYGNKPIVLEDGDALFPSDALIGKMSTMR